MTETKKKKGTTIVVDDTAYRLLEIKKQVLRENGHGRPSFSDAVRLACGKILVKFDNSQNYEDGKDDYLHRTGYIGKDGKPVYYSDQDEEFDKMIKEGDTDGDVKTTP